MDSKLGVPFGKKSEPNIINPSVESSVVFSCDLVPNFLAFLSFFSLLTFDFLY